MKVIRSPDVVIRPRGRIPGPTLFLPGVRSPHLSIVLRRFRDCFQFIERGTLHNRNSLWRTVCTRKVLLGERSAPFQLQTVSFLFPHLQNPFSREANEWSRDSLPVTVIYPPGSERFLYVGNRMFLLFSVSIGSLFRFSWQGFPNKSRDLDIAMNLIFVGNALRATWIKRKSSKTKRCWAPGTTRNRLPLPS